MMDNPDCHPTPLPSIRLRDVDVSDAADLARILIGANESAFRGLVPSQCLAFTEDESAANWRRTLREGFPPGDFMLIAESPPGMPTGYAWGGLLVADPVFGGELRQLNVGPANQHRGIGRALVRGVARRLVGQGIQGMSVEVLRINPNRTFYERLGARFVSERPFDWDGVELVSCRYGWPDLALLLDA